MALNKAFLLFDANNSGDISEDEMVQIIRAAVDFKPDNDQLKEMMDKFRSNDTNRIEYKEFRKFLLSGEYRHEESGRFTTAVSLAEAETIRRIMHIRLEKSIIDHADTSIALRCVPAGNSVLDASLGFVEPAAYQRDVAHQSLRFLDCDMFYKDNQINVLVRALQGSTPRDRIVSIFFVCVL